MLESLNTEINETMELMFKSLLNEHSFLKVIITIIIENQSPLGVSQWRCGPWSRK